MSLLKNINSSTNWFSKPLISWYKAKNRELPWRKSKKPYFVWLSEIMLQQTRIEQALPYYLNFTENFPTVFDLANASEEKVLKLWQGLGYYSRARNLHSTAKHVANQLDGIFPKIYKELIKLKGIGDYTASAIASICFNEPNAVVDGNVYRVLSRYFGIKTPINSTEGIKEFKNLAQKLLDIKQSGVYNQALMDFGALHCKPQNPLCEECFFNTKCVAFLNTSIDNFPVKIKKTKIKKRYFNYLYAIVEDNTAISKRTKGIWKNLYEFPLIESTKSIDVKKLIETEKFNKLFPNHTEISLWEKEIIHKLSHQHLYTKFWIIKTSKINHNTIKISDLKNYPVPILIENFINTI